MFVETKRGRNVGTFPKARRFFSLFRGNSALPFFPLFDLTQEVALAMLPKTYQVVLATGGVKKNIFLYVNDGVRVLVVPLVPVSLSSSLFGAESSKGMKIGFVRLPSALRKLARTKTR